MARDTNFQTTVVAYLRQLSSGDATGATEQTALDILAALPQINTNLTDNTNSLLTEIRDSNVVQEALINESKASQQVLISVNSVNTKTTINANTVKYIDVVVLEGSGFIVIPSNSITIPLSTDLIRKYERKFDTYIGGENPHDIIVEIDTGGKILIEIGLI